MSWDKGFNFRQDSTFVTDGANETYVATDTYPVTRNGVTFGWDNNAGGSLDFRNRNSTSDRRLAGINFVQFGSTGNFRVDLPSSGDYNISLAMGDEGADNNSVKVTISDSAATLWTVGPHNMTAANFYDAKDATWTEAQWPGSNNAQLLTFAGPTLNMGLSGFGGPIAHLFISQVASTGGGGTTRNRLRWRGVAHP
jgi:hypothetical protein